MLGLQNHDGGFDPDGGGGACEDVDAIDILVNVYKRSDYKHADIRHALRRCAAHMLRTQNNDGGFPYERNRPQSHMGIPGTAAPANSSTSFATWFRLHSLALCGEVLPDYASLLGAGLGFSRSLSMGWHASPASWSLQIGVGQAARERSLASLSALRRLPLKLRRGGGRVARRLGLRRTASSAS